MNIFELVDAYKAAQDAGNAIKAFACLASIEEVVGALKTELKPTVIADGNGKTSFEDLGKTVSVIDAKTTTLKIDDIKKCLTDGEIRQVYKPTASDLKALGKENLLNLSETVTVKQVRVSKLKELKEDAKA